MDTVEEVETKREETLTPLEFATNYINAALNLVKESEKRSRSITLEVFDNSLRTNVSQDLGMPPESVLYLHHPFHWAFFCDRDSPSPLELASPNIRDGRLVVACRREISDEDCPKLTCYVLEKYGTYLSAKFSKINNSPR